MQEFSLYGGYGVNALRFHGLTSHIGKAQTWNRVLGRGVQVISMQEFMRGEYIKVYGAQHIQSLGSCKPIRQSWCYSLVVLYVLPIRQLLSARHPLGSFAKYPTNLHGADGSCGGEVARMNPSGGLRGPSPPGPKKKKLVSKFSQKKKKIWAPLTLQLKPPLQKS